MKRNFLEGQLSGILNFFMHFMTGIFWENLVRKIHCNGFSSKLSCAKFAGLFRKLIFTLDFKLFFSNKCMQQTIFHLFTFTCYSFFKSTFLANFLTFNKLNFSRCINDGLNVLSECQEYLIFGCIHTPNKILKQEKRIKEMSELRPNNLLKNK